MPEQPCISHNSQTCPHSDVSDSQILRHSGFSERLLEPSYLYMGSEWPFQIHLNHCFMPLCLLTILYHSIPYIPYGIMIKSLPSLPNAPIRSQSVEAHSNASKHFKTLRNATKRSQTPQNAPQTHSPIHPNASKMLPDTNAPSGSRRARVDGSSCSSKFSQ